MISTFTSLTGVSLLIVTFWQHFKGHTDLAPRKSLAVHGEREKKKRLFIIFLKMQKWMKMLMLKFWQFTTFKNFTRAAPRGSDLAFHVECVHGLFLGNYTAERWAWFSFYYLMHSHLKAWPLNCTQMMADSIWHLLCIKETRLTVKGAAYSAACGALSCENAAKLQAVNSPTVLGFNNIWEYLAILILVWGEIECWKIIWTGNVPWTSYVSGS